MLRATFGRLRMWSGGAPGLLLWRVWISLTLRLMWWFPRYLKCVSYEMVTEGIILTDKRLVRLAGPSLRPRWTRGSCGKGVGDWDHRFAAIVWDRRTPKTTVVTLELPTGLRAPQIDAFRALNQPRRTRNPGILRPRATFERSTNAISRANDRIASV